MTEQHRILTGPVRLTGSVHPEQLALLIAIDAMVRRRPESGKPDGGQATIWELSTIAGDVAVQRAVQRAVAREGDDRDEMGREGFAARTKRLEADAEADLRRLLGELRINADTEHWRAGSQDSERTARVAFVRLYEAGVLTRTDAVLDSCPSCETVVDETDTDIVELDVDQLRISVPLVDGTLEIDVAEPELIVGAVAVAVPAATAPSDTVVELPLLDAEVPIVAVEGLQAPVIVVPGHDRWSHDLARQLNYPIIEVLDGEGVVRHPGPLEGLGRYAARAAATETLTTDGFVTAHFEATQPVRRCYRCATVLVPLLGRHWILSLADMAAPVVEALHLGQVELAPRAFDRMLESAQRTGAWCVSQQLWSGARIPVSTCLDCGKTVVSVEQDSSCGSCMGTLEPHTDVLDARFIAAVTPLAMLGWPQAVEHIEHGVTLAVGNVGLDAWALPMAALGLRLAGIIPFSEAIVRETNELDEDPGHVPTSELVDLVAAAGARTVRVALIGGHLDVERAKAMLDLLDSPALGTSDLPTYIERVDKALGSLDAAAALDLLTEAAGEGIPAESVIAFGALVDALAGDRPAS